MSSPTVSLSISRDIDCSAVTMPVLAAAPRVFRSPPVVQEWVVAQRARLGPKSLEMGQT